VENTKILHSAIRGAGLFGRAGRRANASLRPAQPLLLQRETDNRADPNAIIVMTLLGEPAGYVAREDAAVVAPQLDRGILWLARVRGRRPWLLLYRDEEEQQRELDTKLSDFDVVLRRRMRQRAEDDGVVYITRI
jgi:hypothetical protein